mgnify:CR=1 FL=1
MGVIIAATINIITAAYFLFFLKIPAFRIFSLVNIHAKTGISKTSPHPSVKASTNEIYLLTDMTGVRSSPAKLIRNLREIGNRQKKQKPAPMKNENHVKKIKFIVCLLCLSSSAGEINLHI